MHFKQIILMLSTVISTSSGPPSSSSSPVSSTVISTSSSPPSFSSPQVNSTVTSTVISSCWPQTTSFSSFPVTSAYSSPPSVTSLHPVVLKQTLPEFREFLQTLPLTAALPVICSGVLHHCQVFLHFPLHLGQAN